MGLIDPWGYDILLSDLLGLRPLQAKKHRLRSKKDLTDGVPTPVSVPLGSPSHGAQVQVIEGVETSTR